MRNLEIIKVLLRADQRFFCLAEVSEAAKTDAYATHQKMTNMPLNEAVRLMIGFLERHVDTCDIKLPDGTNLPITEQYLTMLPLEVIISMYVAVGTANVLETSNSMLQRELYEEPKP